jgi:hypothetical protein
MKVMFICGSFEPGRDGVGDYTRRLSHELAGNGIEVAVAAINDGHISEISKTVAHVGQIGIATLRLPATLNHTSFDVLKDFVDQFNPDWISLQYVPFSFHPKGLGFGLSKKLLKAGQGRKWQIMFHEIAVGMPTGSSIKEMLWGKAQKYLAENLIKVLKPFVVHTHTMVYKKQLEKFGAQVTLLPLFSNIPVSYPNLILEKLEGRLVKNEYTDLLVFATVQLGAPIRQFARDVQQYENASGLKFRMVFLGRGGKAKEEWVNEWKTAGLETIQMGELDEEKISEVMAKASFGIFSTPLVLTGKSGAVAAMREHGIHLLCVSGNWEARGLKVRENPFGILEYRQGELDRFFKGKSDFSNLPTVPSVSKQFMSDLKIN